ncbi:hypothetical protein MUP46_03915 [Patescibacteria group bacterium]|nr:hypothetical protein [Patescibacteria group bacterium]
MKKFLKVLSVFSLYSVLSILFPSVTYAVCPVCTVAVVAGLGLSRWLGVDDTVSGIWIGGVILSTSFLFASWLKKKNITFPYLTVISAAIMYAIVLLPLQFAKIIGHPLNTLWGVDKLILGTLIGSVVFLTAVFADRKVREIKGKQLFIFQRVIFPVGALAIMSLVFYFVTRH